MALELCDLLPEHVWSVSHATNHADATSVSDGRRQLGAGSDVHASKHDRVGDLEKIGGHRADLFCLAVSMLLFRCRNVSGAAYEVKSWLRGFKDYMIETVE